MANKTLSLLITILLWLFVSSAAFAQSTETRELVLLSWADYLKPELLERFEHEHDVRVKMIYFESDDARDVMLLESNAQGCDLAIIDGASMDGYRESGWIVALQQLELESAGVMEPRWMTAFQNAGSHGVPYFWGTLGIAYRSDLVAEPMTHWKDIYSPAPYLAQKLMMVGNRRDLIGMALKSLGYSANSSNSVELRRAEALLLAQRAYVRDYSDPALDEKSALHTGDVIAAMMYSGDAIQLGDINDRIEYVLPAEGGNIWVDYLVVLSGSKQKPLAAKFVDYLSSAKISAENSAYLYYPSPNRKSIELAPDELRHDKRVYPPQDALSRSEFYTPQSHHSSRLRNSIIRNVMK